MKTKKNLLRLIALFILIAMVASVLGACFADENKDNDEQQNQQPAESNNGNGDDTPDNGNGSGNDQPDVPADEISIVFNDGAGNTETVRVKQGEIVEAPAAPERDGYVFCGWYIEDLGVAYNFDQPLPADTQLKAKWEFDYVAFDQIDVSEFLLKDVGVRIDLSELDFVLLNGDDSRSITSDGPATLFVELNEDGDPYGVVTGSILMSTDYGVANVSYIKAILEDGVVYLEVESEGEFTQARMPLATFFANMFNVDASMVLSLMDDPEQTLEGLAEAYGLEGIPAPIYNMVSQAGQLAAAVAPITMAAVLDVFFTKDTIDGRDYYVLDYDKIAAFNDNLEDLTVAEFINTYAGEAVYETVKLAVRYLLYTPVGNLIDMIDGYISVDALIAYVAGFFPEGITEEQIRVMLAAPELKEATLLDLVAAQQKDSICEAVEAAFAACESNSVYGLIALLAQQSGQSGEYAESDNDFDSEDDGVDPLISANEEEEEIALDLHAIVGELIEIMRDSVSYSFIMEDGKLLAESLDVIDFNLVLDEDVELLVSFCLEADFVDPSFEPEWSEELKSSIDSKKILADVKSMSLYENDDDGSSRTEQLIVDWVNGELPQVYVLTYTKDVLPYFRRS